MRFIVFGLMARLGTACGLGIRGRAHRPFLPLLFLPLILLGIAPAQAQLPGTIRPVTSGGITPECSSPAAVDAVVSRFADDLESVIAELPRLDDVQRGLALESVDALRRDYSSSRTYLCSELTRHQGAGLALMTQAREALGRGSLPSSGCFDRPTYLTLLGIQTILLAYGDSVQAICDATQCTPPNPFNVPECVIGCIGPGIVMAIAESFQLTLDLDDHCSFTFHTEEMDRMRPDAFATLVRLAASASQIQTSGMMVTQDGAQQEDMEGLSEDITDGFDGSGRAVSGLAILPALAALDERVQQETAQQINFENRDLRTVIENALANEITLSTLQLPAAFGGSLELVREIVSEAIAAAQAIGVDIGSALDFFRMGDAALNQDLYRDAFVNYQSAYLAIQTATRNQDGKGEVQ